MGLGPGIKAGTLGRAGPQKLLSLMFFFFSLLFLSPDRLSPGTFP